MALIAHGIPESYIGPRLGSRLKKKDPIKHHHHVTHDLTFRMDYPTQPGLMTE